MGGGNVSFTRGQYRQVSASLTTTLEPMRVLSEVRPITFGKAGDRWLVGYFDGQIDVISL